MGTGENCSGTLAAWNRSSIEAQRFGWVRTSSWWNQNRPCSSRTWRSAPLQSSKLPEKSHPPRFPADTASCLSRAH